MFVSVCLWKVQSRLGFRFSVVLLAVSHRGHFSTESVSSVDLSVSGGWGAGSLLAMLTLYFLLISSITLGMAPLNLQDAALSARSGWSHSLPGGLRPSPSLSATPGVSQILGFPHGPHPSRPLCLCLCLVEMPGLFKKLQAEQQRAAAAARSQAAAAASLFTAAFGRSLASPAAQLRPCWGTLLVLALKARSIFALKRLPSGTRPLYQQRT